MASKFIALRVAPDLHARLVAAAADRPVSDYVRALIERALSPPAVEPNALEVAAGVAPGTFQPSNPHVNLPYPHDR